MDSQPEEDSFPDGTEDLFDCCRHGVSFDDWCKVCVEEMHAELAGIADEPALGPLW